DSKHEQSSFKVGAYVKYRIPATHPSKDKLSPAFLAPCRIAEKLGVETYRIDQLDQKTEAVVRTFVAHSSSLAPYYKRIEPETTDTTPDSYTRRPLPASVSTPEAFSGGD